MEEQKTNLEVRKSAPRWMQKEAKLSSLCLYNLFLIGKLDPLERGIRSVPIFTELLPLLGTKTDFCNRSKIEHWVEALEVFFHFPSVLELEPEPLFQ